MSEELAPALVQLSVCICTRDRPDDLTKALRSVRQSSRPVFQLIVSDDSTDGRTKTCVQESFPGVDFVEGPRRGLSANRNAALAAVRGSHVLFIDDDAELGVDFLANIEATLAGIPAPERDRTIVCGVERKHGELVFANDQTFLGHQRRIYRENDERHTIVINATVFPIGLFGYVGFDTNLVYGYEEVDIATRAVSVGYTIVLCPQAVNDHFPSAVNRKLYQSHVEASRLYVTWKRYAVTQRSFGRALAFSVIAPAHLLASRWRAEGAGAIRSAFTTVARAANHVRAYRTSRSDAPPLPVRPGFPMKRGSTILILLKRVDCNDGVASYLETLTTGLAASGDRVIIVSGAVTTLYGSTARRSAIEAAALKWIVIPELSGLGLTWKLIATLVSMIRGLHVDIVSPQGFAVMPLGVIVGRLCGKRVITNYHPSVHGEAVAAMIGHRSWKQTLAYKVINRVFPSDRYIALSTDIAQFFADECWIAPARIHKQILGIDTAFYRSPSRDERARARATFGLNDDTFVCVLPGRLNLSKGHDLAAAAIRLIRGRAPAQVVCLFPGAGDQQAAIEAEVLQHDEDRQSFRFLGYVDQETLRACYWAADVVLLPSRMEGFGLVVAEAMCCGAIAVRTPSGGWQDQVIEGNTGHVVPFNDAQALADALMRLIVDPQRDQMRERVIAFATSRFSKQRMIEGTSDLYRRFSFPPNGVRTRVKR